MALNGVAWPAGNPKALKVCFTQEEEMKKYQDASTEVGGKAAGEIGDKLTGVREWDKNKVGLDLTDLFPQSSLVSDHRGGWRKRYQTREGCKEIRERSENSRWKLRQVRDY